MHRFFCTFAFYNTLPAYHDVQDKEAIYIYVVKVLAEVFDDLLHLPLYRHHAVPVALYR